jgi:hypothetical protein
MTVEELKNHIEKNTLSDDFLILQYSDSTFLAHQYINQIALNKNLSIHYLTSIEEAGSLLASQYLQVCFLDKYTNEMYCDYISNLIVVCKQVDSGGLTHTVKLPELEEWQIKDYAALQLPGIDDSLVDWLCSICQYDIDRLYLEISKIKIFPKGRQQLMMQELSESNNYKDLSSLTAFDIVKAFICKDLKTLQEYFTEDLNIDELGLAALLLRNFKQIIDIQINSKATPESLGISYKQYKAIQHSCGHYTNQQLIDIYELLTSIDYKIKTGQLDKSLLKNFIFPQILSI